MRKPYPRSRRIPVSWRVQGLGHSPVRPTGGIADKRHRPILTTGRGGRSPPPCSALTLGSTAMAKGLQKEAFGTLPDGTAVDRYTMTNCKRHGGEDSSPTAASSTRSGSRPPRQASQRRAGIRQPRGLRRQEPVLRLHHRPVRQPDRQGRSRSTARPTSWPSTTTPTRCTAATRASTRRCGAEDRRPEDVGVPRRTRAPTARRATPGKLDVEVTYTLTDANEIGSTTRRPPTSRRATSPTTPTSTSPGTAGRHPRPRARPQRDRYTPMDATLIPTGEIAGAGTPFDFKTPTPIGAHPQGRRAARDRARLRPQLRPQPAAGGAA